MNAFPGLTWESKMVDFMDIKITKYNSNKIENTIFEQKMNLQLDIPPHSANLLGLLPGNVCSTLFRIFTLCLSKDDKVNHTKVFFMRLIAHVYKRNEIRYLFHKAIDFAKPTMVQPPKMKQTTMMPFYIYPSIQMIQHPSASKRHGAYM